jgi:hypothetical protein
LQNYVNKNLNIKFVLHLSETTTDTMVDETGKTTPSGPEMYVELNNEQPQNNSLELLETMRSIKAELQSIKEDNEKLLKASREQEELNEILLKNMTEMKHNKNVGQTSSNAKKEVSNDESHKRREHPVFSDKITSMTEENSNNSSEDNTLQKRSPKNKKRKWHTRIDW